MRSAGFGLRKFFHSHIAVQISWPVPSLCGSGVSAQTTKRPQITHVEAGLVTAGMNCREFYVPKLPNSDTQQSTFMFNGRVLTVSFRCWKCAIYGSDEKITGTRTGQNFAELSINTFYFLAGIYSTLLYSEVM